ncbi:MAG: PqqD family protein [Erysipelotrichaceae bacterium]|nr:PqqD family protein [Erysipelotrichaceae bacterium]
MKVSNQFILRTIADEYLLIPTGEAAMNVKGLISLSESGHLLYEKLKNECSKEDLVQVLKNEYEVDESTAVQDVEMFLQQMRQLKMLEEE